MSPMMLPLRGVAIVLMAVVVAACGTPPDDAAPSPAPRTPETDATAPDATDRATPTTAASPGSGSPPPIADDPPALAIERIAADLQAPTSIEATPDGWLLVTERPGRVVAIDPGSGDREVVVDLADRVLGQGEQGLLGLALHPDWPETLRAFVHYSDRGGDTVLAELDGRAGGGAPRLDAASERVLLRVDQPFSNHNGGQLRFGPDGYLWLGLGDGGSGGDPLDQGQDPGTLLGAILRVDVSEPGTYRIPPDNPFVDGGGAPEVHLYGLRNPWRFSFDRLTGELWIADVGQNAFEEINRIDPVADAGGNLGWNVMEASHCFADPTCSSDGLILPVSEYGRELGCSVTGGYVYRGSALPDLVGWYLFADYCTGIVFGVRSDVDELTPPRRLLDTDAAVSSFGEGPGGELYLADLAGAIYRIVAGD
jgi:glucose/arabinose dehydrogenase